MMARIRQIDRRLLTILLIVFVQMLGASMIIPLLPLYAKNVFSLSPQAITLLVSSFFLAQFIAGPPIGRLSDRHGRLPILVISQIGTAISFFVIALTQSAPLLYAARVFDGITGGNIIVAQAYITDITPAEKRTQSLGYVFAAFGLGFIFGPALGGALAAAFGPQVPFLFAATLAVATVALTWYALDETVTPEQRAANRRVRQSSMGPAQIVRNAPLLNVLVIAFFGQFGLGLLQATFALYSEAVLFAGYSEEATNLGIGLLLTAVGLGQTLTQTFILRRALQRFGEPALVILGNVLRVLSMILYAVVTSPWPAAFSGLLFAMGIGLMMPSLQSLSTRTVTDQVRGGVLGLYQSAVSLSTIVSTAIAGVLFAMSPTVPFWVGAFMAALVIPPALILKQQAVQGRLLPSSGLPHNRP